MINRDRHGQQEIKKRHTGGDFQNSDYGFHRI
jgi:hypothetical protein